jgi:hypothetical protein
VFLHVTNGDAVVPEVAAAAGVAPADVLVWREVLHDGPVPAGLGPAELARVRARHLAGRSWGDDEPTEAAALAMFRERDDRLAACAPGAELVLWFEEDLFDRLLLAQVEDRVAGRAGPISRVYLRHPPRGDLRAALAARHPIAAAGTAFAALRSLDPRAWVEIPGFERLLEELPDIRSGLSRTERQILEALAAGPLAPAELFAAVAAREDPPWLGDATVFALAGDLAPLVARADGAYALTPDGAAVLTGHAARPPIDRWLGGVHLGPGHPDWAWNPDTRRPVRLD